MTNCLDVTSAELEELLKVEVRQATGQWLILRSTLEELSIEQALEGARLTLAAAQHDQYVAAAAVLNAVGQLQVEALVPDIDRYDPARSFKRVQYSGAVPWEPLTSTLDHLTAPRLTPLPAAPAGPLPMRSPGSPPLGDQ